MTRVICISCVGHVAGWIDFKSICTDQTLPLIREDALRASLRDDGGRRLRSRRRG